MDSEEETFDDVDSGNESSGDDVDFAMEVELTGHRDKQADNDEYPYEVLSTEQIVQHMVDCIKEVNSVVEVSATYLTFGILLYFSKQRNTSGVHTVQLEKGVKSLTIFWSSYD